MIFTLYIYIFEHPFLISEYEKKTFPAIEGELI